MITAALPKIRTAQAGIPSNHPLKQKAGSPFQVFGGLSRPLLLSFNR